MNALAAVYKQRNERKIIDISEGLQDRGINIVIQNRSVIKSNGFHHTRRHFAAVRASRFVMRTTEIYPLTKDLVKLGSDGCMPLIQSGQDLLVIIITPDSSKLGFRLRALPEIRL